jgi:indole-3-glycerol phosphate synthase
MDILERIFNHKREEVARRQRCRPLGGVRADAEAAPAPADFVSALRHPKSGGPALIAEIKRASPSRGVLMPEGDTLHLAETYSSNGASAISVLTDERFFQGSLEDLMQVRDAQLGPPLLRKDFICHPYQVYEARAAGADAVLLIAAALEVSQIRDLQSLAEELGMAALVEVHSLAELEAALSVGPALLGINNRNLHDFSVSLETTLCLRGHVPQGVCLVSESGIHDRADVQRLEAAGVDAILVGEALVTSDDVARKVRQLSCSQ